MAQITTSSNTLPRASVDGEKSLIGSSVLDRAFQGLSKGGPNQQSSLHIRSSPPLVSPSSSPNSSSAQPSLPITTSSSAHPTIHPISAENIWSSSSSPSPNLSGQRVPSSNSLDISIAQGHNRLPGSMLGGALLSSAGSVSNPAPGQPHNYSNQSTPQPLPVMSQHHHQQQQHNISRVADRLSSAPSNHLSSSLDCVGNSNSHEPKASGPHLHLNTLSSSSSSSSSSTNQPSPPSSLLSSGQTSTPPSLGTSSAWRFSGNSELLNYSNLLNDTSAPAQDHSSVLQPSQSFSSPQNLAQFNPASQASASFMNQSNRGGESIHNPKPVFNSELNHHRQPLMSYAPSPRSTPNLGLLPLLHPTNGGLSNSLSSPVDGTFNLLHHRPYSQHPSHITGWHGGLDGYSTAFYDPFQIKHRRRTTPAQLGILEAQFESNCKPDVVLRKQLAEQLDMTPREVQVWFQNRRAKTKKLEKRAEQESGKPNGENDMNSSSSVAKVNLSPPSSVFLGPHSGQMTGLPNTRDESPEGLGRRSSTPSAATPISRDQMEDGDPGGLGSHQQRLEVERRCRSRSLHHHPYFLPPSSAQISGQSSALSSLLAPRPLGNPVFGLSGHNEEQASVGDRRDSRTSIASSMTASNSSVAQTPTTTEFGHDDSVTMITAGGYPDGYDPRRRSSCPADFIQSFDHFGLSPHDISSLNSLATNFESIPASQAVNMGKQPSSWTNGGIQTSVLDSAGGNYMSDWNSNGGEDWRPDALKEGSLPRRHSLATIRTSNSSRISQLGQQQINEGSPVMIFSDNKALDGSENPSKNNLSGSSSIIGPGGYTRRSSTSVLLNSIEEHPSSSWNP